LDLNSAPGGETISETSGSTDIPETLETFESLDDFSNPAAVVPPPEDEEPLTQFTTVFANPSESISEEISLSSSDVTSSTGLTSEPVAPTIDTIKSYSESLNEQAQTSAALPFTLKIDGSLSPQEKEKLLDILSREKIGIREVDLEPQFAAGKILLPRISEYAGVLLIQGLRGVQAKISFGPSDSESLGELSQTNFSEFHETHPAIDPQSANELPVTKGDDLPQLGVYQVMDTLVVSGLLTTRSLEAVNSTEFTALTEALIRELKFKASRRGGRGIVHLSIELTPMTLPTDYRVTVTGTAVH
jgi:hypothetical protein